MKNLQYTLIHKNNDSEFCIRVSEPGSTESLGEIWVCSVKMNFFGVRVALWETHSSVITSLRNKGVGVTLYDKAIAYCLSKGYRIGSATNTSPMAQRVWLSKRLNTKYRIFKVSKRYYVFGKK